MINDREVHEFVDGDGSLPKCSENELMLSEISLWLKLLAYKESTGMVLFDIEEEEKESATSKRIKNHH